MRSRSCSPLAAEPWRSLVAVLLLAVACACRPAGQELATIETEALPPLPWPTTNNAVAGLSVPAGPFLFTFMGLGTGKQFGDTHSRAAFMGPGSPAWEALPDVPGSSGRLAAVAATIRGRILVFGGYTVAADGTEVSTPAVWALDVASGNYLPRAPMPVAVDDTVALPYRDQFVYLVSGWHDEGNVSDVQLYDAVSDAWQSATPFPGTPVFGHAAGIVGDRITVCDGVRVESGSSGPRRFAMSDECWVGDIASERPGEIAWRHIEAHPGRPRYRMAATGDSAVSRFVFAGGSEVAYNYDGIGYEGAAAEPSDVVFTLDAHALEWREVGRLDVATMDHRGLLVTADGRFVIVGGMRSGREVSRDVLGFALPAVR